MADELVDPLLPRELDKLKKADLIELLIYNKVPDSINSEVINKFVKRRRDECEKKKVFNEKNSLGNITCDRKECMENFFNLKSTSCERNCLDKNIQIMEKRIMDLEYIISLLQGKEQNFVCNKAPSVKVTPTPSSSKMENNSRQMVENCNNYLKESREPSNDNNLNSENQGEWHTANHKRNKRLANKKVDIKTTQNTQHIFTNNEVEAAIKSSQNSLKYSNNKRKPIIGSNKSNASVKSVPKLGYLHVYRLNPDTLPKDLEDDLRKTTPHIPFKCEPLHSSEKSCSMVVSFPICYVNEVYNPEIWPDGAMVNRFRFFKNSNFPNTISERAQN